MRVTFASDLEPGRIVNVVTDSIKFKVILIGFNLELKKKKKSYILGSRSAVHMQNGVDAAWERSTRKHLRISGYMARSVGEV